jgi:hypothetical protein
VTRSDLTVPAISAVPSACAWSRQLGVNHRQRDDAAGNDARALEALERERHVALRQRWPNIAAAIRASSQGYNEGVGLEVLTVTDHASDDGRDAVVQIVARGGQTLTMTLVGVALCVHTTPSSTGAADDGRRWITCGASDEAIAAYALQPWLIQM